MAGFPIGIYVAAMKLGGSSGTWHGGERSRLFSSVVFSFRIWHRAEWDEASRQREILDDYTLGRLSSIGYPLSWPQIKGRLQSKFSSSSSSSSHYTTASLISSFFNAEARFSADQPIRLDYLYDEPSLRCRSKRGSRILSTFNRFCPLRLSLSPFSLCIPTSRRPGPCLSVGVGRARVGAVPIFGQRVEATSLSETLLHHVVVITAEPLGAREASTFWKFHDFQYYVSMEAKDWLEGGGELHNQIMTTDREAELIFGSRCSTSAAAADCLLSKEIGWRRRRGALLKWRRIGWKTPSALNPTIPVQSDCRWSHILGLYTTTSYLAREKRKRKKKEMRWRTSRLLPNVFRTSNGFSPTTSVWSQFASHGRAT